MGRNNSGAVNLECMAGALKDKKTPNTRKKPWYKTVKEENTQYH